eukprot:ANDGO_06033.mRNA.1 putative FAD synthase
MSLDFVSDAKSVIREALDKFPVSQLAFSFNGGKDSTVLLFLFLDVLKERNIAPCSVVFFYLIEEPSFPEIDDFVAKTARSHGLCVDVYSGMSLKQALFKLKQEHGTCGVFVGSRSTDPYCAHLSAFTRTDVDHGWPDMVRINPILQWSYAQVWKYLRPDNEPVRPYCVLYDQGYTSIGRVDDTRPNEDLRIPDDTQDSFLPAYRLVDESKERAGRLPKSK